MKIVSSDKLSVKFSIKDKDYYSKNNCKSNLGNWFIQDYGVSFIGQILDENLDLCLKLHISLKGIINIYIYILRFSIFMIVSLALGLNCLALYKNNPLLLKMVLHTQVKVYRNIIMVHGVPVWYPHRNRLSM